LAAVEENDAEEALDALERGIRAVRRSYIASARRKALQRSPELKLLRSMRRRFLEQAVVADQSMDTVEQLQRQLDEALEEEKYELAIALRDQLQALERDRQP
jgi:excinuclease UvrABC helicase subunit UvrB